ncbi:hypothetical protein [Streptomyces sp. NBC_00388]|uniref:hypothetical protein n=1 Tax=Streptomyces sp. NBC_00388 TaxID=2975735 RepID=UPI002E24B7BD
MVEGEKGSRHANGSSGGAPRQRRPAAPAAGEDAGQPPGDLAQLLASVGALLGSHAAEDLVVLVREELERREFVAYGRGWRDAAAQYHQSAEGADAVRAGEAGDRVPGQAAVIPFRRRERYERPEQPQLRPRSEDSGLTDAYGETYDDTYGGPYGAEPLPGEASPADAAETGAAAPAGAVCAAVPEPRTARGPRRRPPAPEAPAAASPRPAFAPKSRRSKVPTIPRLPRSRGRGRPDEDERPGTG